MRRRASGAENDGTNLTEASGFAFSTAEESDVACDDDYMSIDDDAPMVPTPAVHQQLLQISRARMQPFKRMKTLKQEDLQGGALCSPAAQEKDGDGGPVDEGAHATADTPSHIVSLKVHFETQAAAIQLLEQTEVMGRELEQAKAEVVELKADIRLKASALQAQDAFFQASLLAKDAVILAKDAEIQRLQAELERRDAAAAVGGSAQSAATAAAAAAAVAVAAYTGPDALFPFADGLPDVVISNNRLTVANPTPQTWRSRSCAWVLSERGVAAGCGVVRWAVKLGFSDKFGRYNAEGRNFCLGVASDKFTEFTECFPKQSWFFKNDYMVVNGRKVGDVFTPRPFATQDIVTIELERAPGVVGVLRVWVAGKTPREWRGLPSDGMLWPLVCLVHGKQSYTMVVLP
jgi:hypothetical protein